MEPSRASFLAAVVFLWTLATAALVGRLVARRLTNSRYWWDDYTAVVAFVFLTGNNIIYIIWLQDGLTLHRSEITWLAPDEATLLSKRDQWFTEQFYALTLGTSKLAVLGLYWRLFSAFDSARYAIGFLAIAVLLWVCIRLPLGIIQCLPIRAYWVPSVPIHCYIDVVKLYYGAVISNLCLDVLILSLPVVHLRKLGLSWRRKLGVMVLFLAGISTCGASLAVLIGSTKFDSTSPELPFNIGVVALASALEVNLSIISANLPILRPLYVHARRHLTGHPGREYAPPPPPGPAAADDHHRHLPLHHDRRRRRQQQHHHHHQQQQQQQQQQRSPTAPRQQQRRRTRGPWTLEFTWLTPGTLRTTVADKFASLSSGSLTVRFASNQRSRVDAAGAARDQDPDEPTDGVPRGPASAGVGGGGGGGVAISLEHIESGGGLSGDTEMVTPVPSGGVQFETVYFDEGK